MKNLYNDSQIKSVKSNPYFNVINDRSSIKKWVGIVVDNQDPLKEGRCKCKVFGKWDGLANDELIAA